MGATPPHVPFPGYQKKKLCISRKEKVNQRIWETHPPLPGLREGLGSRASTLSPYLLSGCSRALTLVTTSKMAGNLPSSRSPETGKPCGGKWAQGKQNLSPHCPLSLPRGLGPKSTSGPTRVAAAGRAMTQQLYRGLLPSPTPRGPASPICFSAPGAWQVCTKTHQGAGQGRKI